MDILLPGLIKCTAGIKCNKPYCDIIEVATRVTKETQSGHLTPRYAHVTHTVTRGQFWDSCEHLTWQYVFIHH